MSIMDDYNAHLEGLSGWLILVGIGLLSLFLVLLLKYFPYITL